jgi:hypothetical protein
MVGVEFERAVRRSVEMVNAELGELERELHEVLEVPPAPFESPFA